MTLVADYITKEESELSGNSRGFVSKGNMRGHNEYHRPQALQEYEYNSR